MNHHLKKLKTPNDVLNDALQSANKRILEYQSEIGGLKHRMSQGRWKVTKELEAENKAFREQRTRIMKSELALQAENKKLKEGVIIPRELSDSDYIAIRKVVRDDVRKLDMCYKAIIEHFTKQETPKDNQECYCDGLELEGLAVCKECGRTAITKQETPKESK